MSAHRLLLHATGGALAGLSANDLLWRPHGEQSSVATTLGPRLEGLGPVPPLHVDFVRLAGLAFFCDRTVPRPRTYRRVLDLDVAVSDPGVWEPHAGQLAALLQVLTGDDWGLTFSRRREPLLGEVAAGPEGGVGVLFSGGADSACGVVAAHSEGMRPVLVSHHDWRNIRGQQSAVLTALEEALGARPADVSWRFAREASQLGSGARFGDEPSRRSRSVLFIALGLAVAAMTNTELWLAENGFTSLNPPLSGERRGSLSTRTTHPTVLLGLREVLGEIGLNAEFRNPFADMTKGQAYAAVREALGVEVASEVLSQTNSCAKPQRLAGFAPDAQCGVCMGCLVRRAAFIASGLEDRTIYKERALEDDGRRGVWLSPARRTTYESLRYRIEIGYSEEDILDLGLPDDADIDAALDIANAGLAELAQVEIP